MATATVGVSPVRGPRINQNLYVGQAGIRTIQAAVNYAGADGGIFVVVIPFGHNSADLISTIVNGSASIILSDQRGTNPQNYVWSGAAYVPADFKQLGRIFAGATGNFVVGDLGGGYTALTLNGNLNNGSRAGLSSSPSDPELYIDAPSIIVLGNAPDVWAKVTSIGLSIGNVATPPTHALDIADITGTTVVASIDNQGDANLGSLTVRGQSTFSGIVSFAADCDFGGNLSVAKTLTVTTLVAHEDSSFAKGLTVAGSPVRTFANTPDLPGAVYPGAGLAVSTGTAWGTSIDPATMPRLNTANTFTAAQTINGTLTVATNFLAGSIGNGYTALALNGNLANGQRCGMSSSPADEELYLDTKTLFVFQNFPAIYAKITPTGMSVANGGAAPTHAFDVGTAGAYIDTDGSANLTALTIAGSPIIPANLAKTNAANTFNGAQTISGSLTYAGALDLGAGADILAARPMGLYYSHDGVVNSPLGGQWEIYWYSFGYMIMCWGRNNSTEQVFINTNFSTTGWLGWSQISTTPATAEDTPQLRKNKKGATNA